MDLAQWKQLDNLLQSALELPLEQRDDFLRRTCAGDDRLERQVRSLLSAAPDAERFLQQPAIEVAAMALSGSLSKSPTETADTLIGTTLSHYRIVERLGRGGMGVVYKAEDARLGRFVALKFLTDELARDGEALSRFRREARTASGLNHPGICTIHDVGEQDGRSFIAMEYLEGSTLRDRLADHQPLDLDTVLTLGIEIADALQAAHGAGVVHRDIKPANIFISPCGAKVLDFGLATMGRRRAPGDDSGSLTMAVTTPGAVLGTAAYMAPEQARGETVDHRSDIWALGLVLYEMATGTRPMAAVRLRVEHSPELERIISKCLEADREHRYRHASDIRDDLQQVNRHPGAGPATGPVTAARERATRAGGMRIVAVFGVLTLALAGYGYFQRVPVVAHRQPPPALTDRDTIVIADFDNRTGDAMFDGMLRQGLAVQLEQSPYLSLVSDERIQRTLRLMGRPPDAHLTPQLAREICERTSSAAVLEGSIAVLGSQYVVGVRASHCATGDILDEQQVQAPRKEDVLDALSQMASIFRTRVGESVAAIGTHDKPLEDVTTRSLEAFKAYSSGRKVHAASGPAALPLFKRATELDPTFAIAHAFLGTAYRELGEYGLAAASIREAYRLRERASDLENFFITTVYDLNVTGNLEKAQQTCELWAQTYPRDWRAHGFLTGVIYPALGKYERAVDEGRTTLELNP
ncbi:MAG: serine/threonine-protein kinase, partial [Vicinamibacterales bacterium]